MFKVTSLRRSAILLLSTLAVSATAQVEGGDLLAVIS
jgi:hypothetical protein